MVVLWLAQGQVRAPVVGLSWADLLERTAWELVASAHTPLVACSYNSALTACCCRVCVRRLLLPARGDVALPELLHTLLVLWIPWCVG